MKRRDFLKLGVGASAIVAMPSLVNANNPQKEFDFVTATAPLTTRGDLTEESLIQAIKDMKGVKLDVS